MALLLQPGDRAETHGMPISELNGQKGTIVCYMESTGRYLLELDDTGKTLSLRKNNIKTEGETESAGDDPQVETVEDADDLQDPIEQMPKAESKPKPKPKKKTKPTPSVRETKNTRVREEEDTRDRIFKINDIVTYLRVDGTTSRALITGVGYVGDCPSYVIRILSSGVEKTTSGEWLTLISAASNRGQAAVREPNILESLLFTVYDTVASASWPTLFVGFLAILWMWPDGSNHSTTTQGHTSYHNDYYHWGWSYYHPYYWHWWGIVGGLGSFILVGVMAQKLGTNNGKRTFSWDRAWQGVLEMDFWELIRMAAILEGAIYFLGNFAAGPRRRR